MAVCRWSGQAWEGRVGRRSLLANDKALTCARCALQIKLEECSVRSDDHGKPACYYTQLHASNAPLPEFLRHRSLEDAVSPMHSYTVQLLPLEKQGGGQSCDTGCEKDRIRYQCPSKQKHMEDAVSLTLALTRAPSRWEAPPTPLSHRCGMPDTLLHHGASMSGVPCF